MEKYIRQFDTCRQNEKPFCTGACPFHMDVLDFQAKMASNNYNAAFKTFRNAVGFPDVAAAMCTEYCAAVCPRSEIDQSVQLSLLEKTCVAKATKKDPTDYNVPIKNRKIAIIGAGISGLACAVRLVQKKYDVTIFEKSGRLGGKLWDMLPSELFLTDIHRQFQFEKYTLNFNSEIKNIEEIREGGFEAVYVATGEGGPDFGALDQEAGNCILNGEMAVFAGGTLTGKDPIRALAEGLDMARSIEIFLKTGKLEPPEGEQPCRAAADPDKLQKTDGVIPTENGIFSDEEAAAEAARCIRCQCDACMKYCDVCAFHGKWPTRIRDEILGTVAFSTSESLMKKTPAKRLMNTCTQCGLCDEVCPENIEIGGLLLEARRSLHKLGTMPGPYHQFWLRDMEFTNGEFASLIRKAPGQNQCSYAFFPGCQLGAADPRYVMEPYQWLLAERPETGMLLRCCGVPAEWAGNEELHDTVIAELRGDWETLGKPTLILACPACGKHLKEYLPEIETISLYEALDQWGDKLPEQNETNRKQLEGIEAVEGITEAGIENDEIYSVFDPCTARHNEPVEKAVRNLAGKAGLNWIELPKGDKHGCCGYGGNGSEANPDFTAYVAKERSALSPNPYLTYCINCRDVFKGEGKPVKHILDLIFGIDVEYEPLPNLTARRNHRIELKEKLLKEVWGEEMENQKPKAKFDLKIGPEVHEKMNRLKILEEDICKVLELSESSKRRTYDPQAGTFTGYRELGYITFWVEYRINGQEYEVVSVYTHRMKIKLEGVWNGRKTDADL